MKPPPFLCGAALLFWGWQTGFLAAGAIMAAALEGARFTTVRWELSDEDFSRIWTFCALLFLGTAVYAFTANDGPASFGALLRAGGPSAAIGVGATSARAFASWTRWMPMVFFLFAAAQSYSPREGIPLEVISLILRRRWRKARQEGRPTPASQSVNVGYPYFAVCLLAASAHSVVNPAFFWGLCALLAWGLWPRRSLRFSIAIWAATLGLAAAAGYFGQLGILPLQRLIEGYNPQWFANSGRRNVDPEQTRTFLGQVGRLKLSGKIVIRLEPKNGSPPPAYLREAAYRAYRSPSWHTGSSKDDFVNVTAETNGLAWPLLPDKAAPFAVNIACYLDGGKALLPLPTGVARLENLPAFTLQKNSAGAVLADGPGLVVFDALYGPGRTIDSPPDPVEDLAVPAVETPALDQVISELHLTGDNTNQTLGAINAFFQSQFTYSLWQGLPRPPGTNETALRRFLLQTRSGHCEYFATAAVLLLRQLHIPARYAVGYAVHEHFGGKYVVRQRDAHAWCLVWRNGTWQDFDTTPASWIQAEGQRASALQFLSDFWSRLVFEFSKFRWGQTHLRDYLLWTLAPVLVLLLFQIVFRGGRRRSGNGAAQTGAVARPGLDSEFYQLENALAQRGLTRQSHETLSDWLQRAMGDPALANLRVELGELLRLHYRYRFDPRGLPASDRETLRREASSCLARLVPARK